MHTSPLPSFRPAAVALLAGLLAWGWTAPSAAQSDRREGIDVVVTGGSAPIRLAVPDPVAGRGAGSVARTIASTLRDDLDSSGWFALIEPRLYGGVAPSDPPVHDDWVAIGADTVVLTRVSLEGGRIDLQAKLYDNDSGTLMFAMRYGGSEEIARRVAHQLADDLVEHLTGTPGVALTRICFVSRHGDGKEVYLMDYDGSRVRRITTSGTINLGPTWSPSGDELAFVSWRGKQPSVYAMSSDGRLLSLDTLGGELSSAPDWSSDGRSLAYSSNYHGNTEIYVLDRTSGANRRLTRNRAIDTSPSFSPNGREIAFTSDRGGTPQIYVMDAEGLNPRRVSWTGNYADSAAWAPGGDRLAYAARIDGRFEIVVLDVASGATTRLTRGAGNNENPRWSPDGRHIVFASDRDGNYQIFTMRADGGRQRRLTRGPESYTPDWSP